MPRHDRHATRRQGKSFPAFIAAAMLLVATAAHAQSDSARKQFRQWADERVEVLKKSRNGDERVSAAEYLGGFKYPDVIAALDTALSDPDPRVRAAAAGSLWKSGEAAEPARANLVKALDDPAPQVVVRAAGALQTLGVSQADLVPARSRVFAMPGVSVTDRYLAARGVIGYVPPLSLLAPIVEFLERAATPRTSSSQSIADRETLEGAVSAIERLVKTGDRSLIVPMVEATRNARSSQAALLKALDQFDPRPDGWTVLLVGYLDARDPKVRQAALVLLGKQTSDKDVAIWAPQAATLLRDPDSSVRGEALWSLGRAGGLAAAEVDAVVAMLGDPDADVRRRAAETIGEMGDRTQAITAAAKVRVDERARPSLTALMERDPDVNVRSEAKRSLAKLSGDTSAVTLPGPATDPARAARIVNPSAEASGVALLRERKITMDSGSWFQALFRADVSVVRAFLDAGYSSSAPVAGNGPPLVVALQVGNACAPNVRPSKADIKALVKLLLERGADANGAGANGFTPLMAAAMTGCDREVIKMLIVAGAKVGTTNPAGLSAFDMGLYSGHDGLEELIMAGYRLPPEKVKGYEKAYADKPAALVLVRKAARK
ncbi:MAG: HEAT repeat domain-containing protein [Betaproteobacteria bacterium]